MMYYKTINGKGEIMINNNYKFSFITGSQFLYGDETLRQVENDSKIIVGFLNDSKKLPYPVVFGGIVKTSDIAENIVKEVNYDDSIAGVITFCHTFSPSKMWINALDSLQKPWLHFHTQFNKTIPDEEIDMDYMNLHQSAHGDREHGYIGQRLKKPRKIVMGYWKDDDVLLKISKWMKAAAAFSFSKKLKVMRFGDNMREVAVTEGDKTEAQLKLGWEVNTWGVGALAEEVNKVAEEEIDEQLEVYRSLYDFNTDDIEAVKYQAREEIAIKKMLNSENCSAFTNTFEDLFGLKQLPGIATQDLLRQGYGFGAEGDWKTAALTAVIKFMGKRSAFMEDYTYDLENGLTLGAHMLEVCPSIASGKPKIEVHPLSIGGKEPPARLVFEGMEGNATATSLIDLGGRFRLITEDIECVKPTKKMPNLPVARVMWKPLPDLKKGAECWITAGGAHHTVLSLDVDAEILSDFAKIAGIEFAHIDKNSEPEAFEKELFISDIAWRLKNI